MPSAAPRKQMPRLIPRVGEGTISAEMQGRNAKIARLWIAKAEALEAEAKEPAAAVDAIAEEEVDSEADAPIGVTAAGLARMFERGGE